MICVEKALYEKTTASCNLIFHVKLQILKDSCDNKVRVSWFCFVFRVILKLSFCFFSFFFFVKVICLVKVYPPSAIRHPPSAIRHPPSAIRHPPSAIRHPPSAIWHHPVLMHCIDTLGGKIDFTAMAIIKLSLNEVSLTVRIDIKS